jgi:hypothetical protein
MCWRLLLAGSMPFSKILIDGYLNDVQPQLNMVFVVTPEMKGSRPAVVENPG